MELLQLKYFCHAAEGENFSHTAKKFGVPPSDISQSIKRLERELGCELFERRANSVRLNEKGKSFYTRVSAALEQIKDAAVEMKDVPDRGRITVAIKVNRRIVMQAVENFRRTYTAVDITIKHGDDTEGADLIITAEDMSGKGMTCERLISENIVLAINRESPLAQKEHIGATELARMPFITMNSGQSLHSLTERIGEELGFVPHIAVQSDDPFYIRRCVEMGLGIAFVPEVSWEGQFSDEAVLKEIGDFRRDTYVCYSAGKFIPGRVKEFLRFLREAASL